MSAFSKKVMYGIEAIKTLIKNIIDTYHNIDLSAHKKFNHHLHVVKPDKDSTYTDTSVWEPKLIFEIPDYQGSLNEVKVSNQEGTTQVQYGGIKSVTKNGERNLFVQDWNGVYSTTEFPYGGIKYNHRVSVPGGNTDQMMYNISIRVLDPNIETETSKYPYSGEMNLYVPSLVIHGRGSETSFDTNKYREPRLIIKNDVFNYNSTAQNTAIGHIYFNDASGTAVADFGVDKYLVVDGNNNVSAYRHQCAFNFRSHKGTSYTPMFFRVDTSTSNVDTTSITIATNTFITGVLNVQNNAIIQKASEPSLYIKQTATAYTDVTTNTNCGAIAFLDKNGNGTMAMQHDFKRTSSSYTSELYFTSLGYSSSHSKHELAINALHISVTTTGNTYPPTTHIEAEASYAPSSNQDLVTKKYVDTKTSGSDTITASMLTVSNDNVVWENAGLLGRNKTVNGINYPALNITSVKGKSYYRKHSDGFIEQWGWVKCNSLMAGGQGIKITFPTAYTNHSVVIITAMRTTVDVDSSKQYMSNEYTTVWSTSTTNFIVRHANQAQNNHYIAFYWQAMGK